MNIIATYLYGSLDSDIYMKLPEGWNSIASNKLYRQNIETILHG